MFQLWSILTIALLLLGQSCVDAWCTSCLGVPIRRDPFRTTNHALLNKVERGDEPPTNMEPNAEGNTNSITYPSSSSQLQEQDSTEQVDPLMEFLTRPVYPDKNGKPIVRLYVRSESMKTWLPYGSVKVPLLFEIVDKLCAANGFASGFARWLMETRLSAALDRRIDMMQFGVFEAYPHLYSSGDIEYGYEIITNQLPDAQANKILTLKTVVVKRPGYDPTKQENQRSELYNRTADPAKDPIPIFELYFRPDNMSSWLPCGSLNGTAADANRFKVYATNNIAKKNMKPDFSAAFNMTIDKMQKQLFEKYPELQSFKELEYGYQYIYDGVPDEVANKIEPVNSDVQGLRHGPMKQEDGVLERFNRIMYPPDNDTPFFQLYVRPANTTSWLPSVDVKASRHAPTWIRLYAAKCFASDFAKEQIEIGLSSGLHENLETVRRYIFEAYPNLQSCDELEYGYQVIYSGLPDDLANNIIPLKPEPIGSLLDYVRGLFV